MKAKDEATIGCLSRCEPTEPVFVLRGQDPLAADLVREWAGMMAARFPERREKINGALALADAMDAWPTKKDAD